MTARSPEWERVRATHLASNPRCAVCGKADEVQVHHILPFHLFPEHELDPDNLITLCEKPGHSCHFVFGHFHDWYSYNSNVKQMALDYYTKQQEATGNDNAS